MHDIKILADEHLLKTVVKRLESFGIDIKTIGEYDKKGSLDSEVMELACKERRVILRMDIDFVRKDCKFGVLYFSKRLPNKIMAAKIAKAVNSLDPEDIRGETIFLPWEES